ncbi:uncharacterized protein LACBIDRAFT_292250 [Laccaria bicolor S238N-H82]|uniref:Predicted protein n=1 Tax=Laccaria bicolor (strain S238N-H82 / ATCC MYA-4686) TaxID=486041 RepID=B0CSD2_LACBS|nr:uncharacterized protein LACBIDRAFT_292250 [Laccaria bicolor S238N-H82]EDR14824.1 predicted protein [Laccaria bicolor S238N-H82]|eukprot:XP_001875383.1 predicted protein [Laccaria bicolor S238N-H82]
MDQTIPPKRSAEEIWLSRSTLALTEAKNHPPANAYSGRSVKINGGKLAEGYRVLDTILGRNKVRVQLRRAERHEKKGVKRRRLSSERWRKRFAHEVRKKVELVIKIRNRGA